MFSVRGLPPPPSRKNRTMSIRVRYYGVQDTLPVWRSVDTQLVGRPAARRFPWVEALFKYRYVQPFIHEIKVTVRENGVDEQFVIFCQNHCHLPFNTAVAREWRGEIVVMRLGKNKPAFVNIPMEDAQKIDLAITQFVCLVKQATPFRKVHKNIILTV